MLQVLRSSAGAGKTHALVKRFAGLALAREDPQAYRYILALTFTNKAAAEMKERVLLYLHLLCGAPTDDARIADLLEYMRTEHGSDAHVVRARAERVLAHMLHHWSDLSITTIDAFVRRLVRPFTRDLSLDQELRMTTEQDHYRALALDHLLAQAGQDAALTQVLVAACEMKAEEEKPWDPQPTFAHLGAQLDRETAVEHLDRMHGLEAKDLLRIRASLRQHVEQTCERIRHPARVLLHALRQAGIRTEDMAHGKGGPWGFLERMAVFEGDRGATTNMAKVLVSGKWHSGKAGSAAQHAIEALRPELELFARSVLEMDPAVLRTLLLRGAILDELLPLGALAAMEQAQRIVKEADGVTFFQDLTRSVARLVSNEPVPFLYERLGMRYRHFLIDEFQDTSVMQWHALLPLLENALSEHGTVFVVGDAKQAIYRWRNGEVRQFQALPGLYRPQQLPDGIRRDAAMRKAHRDLAALTDNHRSAPELVAYNNDLFDRLKDLLPEPYRPVYDGLAQVARKTTPGLVTLGSAKPEGAPNEEALEHLLAWVAEALSDGFGPGDLAVLVRSSDQSALVAKALTEAGHAVLSPDGLRLSGDAAVDAVLLTLRFRIHGGDDVAVAALRAAERAGIRTEEPLLFADDTILGGGPSGILREWMRHRGLDRPDPSLLTHLLTLLHAFGLDPAKDAFLSTLLDQARAFVASHGHDASAFLDHMDRIGAARGVALPEGLPAIRILTIHKAKGLQFPVVMLPWTDLNGPASKRDHLWIDPGSVAPDLPAAMIRPNQALADAGVPEVTEEFQLEQLDVLNLLYVAFTRPENRLYALLPAKSNDPFLCAMQVHWQNLPLNREGRYGTRAPAAPRPSTSSASPPPTCPAPSRPTAPLFRTGAPEQWDPDDPDHWRRTGASIHALLASITTVEQLPTALQELVRRGDLDVHEAHRWEPKLRALLLRPDIQPWFSGTGEVLAERTLITAEGHALRPDRILHAEGRWRIMDIKTGSPHDAHREQVERYRDLLHAITGEPVDGSLLYLRDGSRIDIPWLN